LTGLEALQALREGKKIRRKYWDVNMFLNINEKCSVTLSDEYFDTAHYLYKSFAMAVIDVYTDILADDWEVVE
jgi:hypothetical protein